MTEENVLSADDAQAASAKSSHTDWHLLLGAVQEAALTPVAIEVYTEVLAAIKPPRLDLVLLRRRNAFWTPEQQARLPDGIRHSPASHILCEFKYTQSVNQSALVQALLYDHLYRLSRKLKRRAVQTFVISARTPRKEVRTEFGYTATEWPGVYRTQHNLLHGIDLLVLNELSNEPHNALFKCFASQTKESEAAFALLEQMKISAWSAELETILLGLRTLLREKEEETMKKSVITPEYVKQLGEDIKRYVLATAPPQERLAGLAPEERLAGLAPEERLAGLAPEERLAGLSIEVVEAWLRQRKEEMATPPPRQKPTPQRKSSQRKKKVTTPALDQQASDSKD